MGGGGLHPPCRARVFGRKLRALAAMGVDCSRPTCERIPTHFSGKSLRQRPADHAPTTHPALPLRPSLRPCATLRGVGQAVGLRPRHHRRAAVSPTPCIGAATASPPSCRGPRAWRGGPVAGWPVWASCRHTSAASGQPTVGAGLQCGWIASGCSPPHSRLHGSMHVPRGPWAYDDEAVDVLRFFTKAQVPG